MRTNNRCALKESILETLLGVSADTLINALDKEWQKICQDLIKDFIKLSEEEKSLLETDIDKFCEKHPEMLKKAEKLVKILLAEKFIELANKLHI